MKSVKRIHKSRPRNVNRSDRVLHAQVSNEICEFDLNTIELELVNNNNVDDFEKTSNVEKPVKPKISYSHDQLLELRGRSGKVPLRIPASVTKPIQISLSLEQDVVLDTAENAWKPKMLTPVSESAPILPLDDLLKRVRSILNKLTPENKEKLNIEFQSLQIDSEVKLKGVIDLIFEKAVSEPNFSSTYADICCNFRSIIVPEDNNRENKMSFNKILLNHCQKQFIKITGEIEKEKDNTNASCTNDIDDQKIRRRYVGIVRFIGELYKLNMLTYTIMLQCINTLIKHINEESLECLSKLLTTVGEPLEQIVILSDQFSTIDNIITNYKALKISSRIRFMLQDLTDLRNNGWQSRRKATINPQKLDDIKLDIEMNGTEENAIINNYVETDDYNDINKHMTSSTLKDMPLRKNSEMNGGGVGLYRKISNDYVPLRKISSADSTPSRKISNTEHPPLRKISAIENLPNRKISYVENTPGRKLSRTESVNNSRQYKSSLPHIEPVPSIQNIEQSNINKLTDAEPQDEWSTTSTKKKGRQNLNNRVEKNQTKSKTTNAIKPITTLSTNNNKSTQATKQKVIKKDEKSKTQVVNKFSALSLLDTSNEDDQT